VTCKKWFHRRDVGVASLNIDLQNYFATLRGQQVSVTNDLKFSQIYSSTKKHPFFIGKAAAARHLIPFCLTLANRHLHGDAPGGRFDGEFDFRPAHHVQPRILEHRRLVVRLFTVMNQYLTIIKTEPFDPVLCKTSIIDFLATYKALNTMWRAGRHPDETKHMPWHVRPKTHLLRHLADMLVIHGSPSAYWCYGDEDFCGSIKRICAGSRHPRTLEGRVSEKVLLLCGIEGYILDNPHLSTEQDSSYAANLCRSPRCVIVRGRRLGRGFLMLRSPFCASRQKKKVWHFEV
jgi:hypothetical protein